VFAVRSQASAVIAVEQHSEVELERPVSGAELAAAPARVVEDEPVDSVVWAVAGLGGFGPVLASEDFDYIGEHLSFAPHFVGHYSLTWEVSAS
jgi:hypothetical protein